MNNFKIIWKYHKPWLLSFKCFSRPLQSSSTPTQIICLISCTYLKYLSSLILLNTYIYGVKTQHHRYSSFSFTGLKDNVTGNYHIVFKCKQVNPSSSIWSVGKLIIENHWSLSSSCEVYQVARNYLGPYKYWHHVFIFGSIHLLWRLFDISRGQMLISVSERYNNGKSTAADSNINI